MGEASHGSSGGRAAHVGWAGGAAAGGGPGGGYAAHGWAGAGSATGWSHRVGPHAWGSSATRVSAATGSSVNSAPQAVQKRTPAMRCCPHILQKLMASP
ncbi:hypothetical protein [Trebonia sp.]|uniref:hypothetical protein n=1 Tax=Trebonia sp. TaxID=2767075 RepID=UPI00260D74F4|nr:hypothetical protein [Trebonia sp.]